MAWDGNKPSPTTLEKKKNLAKLCFGPNLAKKLNFGPYKFTI